jgi:hypothetical protein
MPRNRPGGLRENAYRQRYTMAEARRCSAGAGKPAVDAGGAEPRAPCRRGVRSPCRADIGPNSSARWQFDNRGRLIEKTAHGPVRPHLIALEAIDGNPANDQSASYRKHTAQAGDLPTSLALAAALAAVGTKHGQSFALSGMDRAAAATEGYAVK